MERKLVTLRSLTTRIRRYAQMSALALSVVLLASQTIAQQHVHVLDGPQENCSLCVQADKLSGVPNSSTATVNFDRCALPTTQHTSTESGTGLPPYQTRAPPRA